MRWSNPKDRLEFDKWLAAPECCQYSKKEIIDNEKLHLRIRRYASKDEYIDYGCDISLDDLLTWPDGWRHRVAMAYRKIRKLLAIAIHR